jgi:hypothetical protein
MCCVNMAKAPLGNKDASEGKLTRGNGSCWASCDIWQATNESLGATLIARSFNAPKPAVSRCLRGPIREESVNVWQLSLK